ncbi:hypothetical protein LCGC14_0659110, partial [marine sediment metagenome]
MGPHRPKVAIRRGDESFHCNRRTTEQLLVAGLCFASLRFDDASHQKERDGSRGQGNGENEPQRDPLETSGRFDQHQSAEHQTGHAPDGQEAVADDERLGHEQGQGYRDQRQARVIDRQHGHGKEP